MRNIWRGVVAVLGAAVIAGALMPVAAPGKKAPPMAFPVGFQTFEPTLGAAPNGDLYFSITPSLGVAIGWEASIAKSKDGGKTWKDVGPDAPTDTGHSMPPETNDPYIYVDPSTGRVFTFHMAPVLVCSVMSFSDDGGKTWTTNPVGCSPTVVWDHQTMVAAKPRTVETEGYPNVLHQCVNAVYAAMCARSVDGGMTWGPSVPVYPNPAPQELCGAQHGHLTAAPNGTIYLPTALCGEGPPTVYISEDDGSTWRESVIADIDIPFSDVSVSVDSAGNVYAAFINERGWLLFAVSKDNGKTWTKPMQIAQGFTANMPVIVAGDPGKVVVAYPGTNDLPKGYDTEGYLDQSNGELLNRVAWGANFDVSYNALAKKPTFRTIVATGSDPIGRRRMCNRGNRCQYLVDFIEAIIGPNGRPYAAFADGCLGACSKSPGGPQLQSVTGEGLMVTIPNGPKFCSPCWRYKPAKGAIDLAASREWASMPENYGVGLSYATLTPELRALQTEATERRLEAVYGK